MKDRVIRPKAVVLPDSALLSKRFTHEVVSRQAYFQADPADSADSAKPDGYFAAHTRVILLEHAAGPVCRVTAEAGTPVYTAFPGLRRLPST